MAYGYIYIIENDVNDKLYVGQTINPHVRWKAHRHKVLYTSVINKAIKKYGSKHFDFVLVEACVSRDELNTREVYWIDELNSISPNGYNLTEGGGSDIPGAETRKKMSVWQKGKKKLSDAQKRMIREFHQGKQVSTETREKISKNSPHRKKISCDHGHPFTEENTAIFTRTDGRKYRRCRICIREINRKSYHRKKLRKKET